MNKQQWWTIMAISYAKVASAEENPGRRKWLFSRATHYMDKAQGKKEA